jgi:hypothetical protein
VPKLPQEFALPTQLNPFPGVTVGEPAMYAIPIIMSFGLAVETLIVGFALFPSWVKADI